ncbi:MAG TPA: histidine triad nucleotide-binding protein [Planctomycetota bacterium]|jgi:histidine triad (HIT) family protein|nr:histidine triad nucleotide-binding protein [Planctomycetota bacterium]
MSDCLFCKIAARQVKADVVRETEDLVAFRDIRPQAPTHVLVIPKRHVATLNDLSEADAPLVGKMFLLAKEIARAEKIDGSGWRTVFNVNRDAGQTVFHIHLHVLGGRPMAWPPG